MGEPATRRLLDLDQETWLWVVVRGEGGAWAWKGGGEKAACVQGVMEGKKTENGGPDEEGTRVLAHSPESEVTGRWEAGIPGSAERAAMAVRREKVMEIEIRSRQPALCEAENL
jgi:hypothetical protein